MLFTRFQNEAVTSQQIVTLEWQTEANAEY